MYVSIGLRALFNPKKALFSTRSSCFSAELSQSAFKSQFEVVLVAANLSTGAIHRVFMSFQ